MSFIQIGLNGRFFPSNWRPAHTEIDFAAAHQFRCIQFRGPEMGLSQTDLGDGLPVVAELLNEANLTATMELLIQVDEQGFTAQGQTPLQILKANLPAIIILPCRYVHWHLMIMDDIPAEASHRLEQKLIPQFKAAVNLAQTYGFTFGFEHNEPELGLFGTPNRCQAMLNAVPDLHFVWDFNHTIPSHYDGFLALSSRLSLLHISDTLLPEVNYHLPLGEGNIDFGLYCQALADAGFSGPAILEIGGLPKSGGYGRDTDEALIASRQLLQTTIDAINGEK